MEVKEHIRKDVANVKQEKRKEVRNDAVKKERPAKDVKKEDKNKM